MEKISKRKALSLVKKGTEIFIQSSKIHHSSIWQRPHSVELKDLNDTWKADTIEESFDKCLNAYHYYNCSKESGLRISYYTKQCSTWNNRAQQKIKKI
jgi:hypothetical protein